MDAETIAKCLNKDLFPVNLRGICGVDGFKPCNLLENCDCYVFNTDVKTGEHWFCIIYVNGYWFLFDSSPLTPRSIHEKVIHKLDKNTNMQVGHLQGVNSMTCGEHCVTFLCLMSKMINDSGSLNDLDYCNVLKTVCVDLHLQPDKYVTEFVYDNGYFPGVVKPPLSEISGWIDDMNIL